MTGKVQIEPAADCSPDSLAVLFRFVIQPLERPLNFSMRGRRI